MGLRKVDRPQTRDKQSKIGRDCIHRFFFFSNVKKKRRKMNRARSLAEKNMLID